MTKLQKILGYNFNQEISDGELRVLIALVDLIDQEDEVFTVEAIAEMVNKTPRSAQRQLNELWKKDYVLSHTEKGSKRQYWTLVK